jgi:mono/diheme cytochrome c family protein
MTSTIRSIAARSATSLAMLLCATTVFAGQGSTSATSGSGLYTNYCATCHGPNAKGDGPMAPALTRKPADLTMIAKKNGGKYPADVVFRTIDGRNPVFGHGGQEMPVWGTAFLRGQSGVTAEQARARVDALVNYLETIQQK